VLLIGESIIATRAYFDPHAHKTWVTTLVDFDVKFWYKSKLHLISLLQAYLGVFSETEGLVYGCWFYKGMTILYYALSVGSWQ